MKINFNAVILDHEGETITEPDPKAKVEPGQPPPTRPFTLASVAYNALLAPDQSATEEDKIDRFTLAMKISEARKGDGIADLTPEQLVDLKKLIGKHPAPLVVGRARELLSEKPEAPTTH